MHSIYRIITVAAFLSLVSVVAVAQTGGQPLFWAGLEHTALGNATLAISPDDHLVVSNIGSSGLDGVTADFGEVDSSCVIWDFEGGLIPAPGASFRYDALGDLGGIPNQVYDSLLFNYVGGTIQLTADSSPVGSSTHRVQVFDGPILLADLSGQTGVLLATADTSKVGGMDVVILFKKDTSSSYQDGKFSADCEMTLGDGSVVVGDRFRITPEAPVLAPVAINGFTLTMQGTPSFVITDELTGVVVPPESIYWAGLAHTSLGNATLSVSPDDHLVVSNIGSSGLDGVSIDVGETAEGFLTEQPVDPAMPVGSWLQSNYFGEVNGVPDQPAGSLGMEWVPGGIAALVDFSPLGSPTFTLELRDPLGNVLANQPGLGSGDVVLQLPGVENVECKCDWDWLDSAWVWTFPFDTAVVSFGTGEDFIASEIIFRPDSPLLGPVQVKRVDVLAAGMPSFETVGDKILVYETYHQVEGGAHLDASGGQLTVSNIGSSGLDGVTGDFGEANSTCVIWDFEGGQIPTPGASYRYDMIGDLGGSHGQVYGGLLFSYVGGTVELTADFTPIGSVTNRVQIFDGLTLVADLSGQSGVLSAAADSCTGGGTDAVLTFDLKKAADGVYCSQKTDSVCGITLGDGTVVTGDRIRITPEAPTIVPTAINGFTLTMQDTPPFVITDELTGVVIPPYSVYWASLNHTARGEALLTVTPDDYLDVSNIGSSGLDGVQTELPADTQEVCVIWDLQSPGTGVMSVEFTGTIDGVVGTIGTMTDTEIPGGVVQLTADYSPLGSTTQRVQIWNGSSLVADFPGQAGVLAEMTSRRRGANEGFIDFALGGTGASGFAGERKTYATQPITAGPLGEVFLGDRIVVIPEGTTSVVDDLQGIVVLCSGIDSLVLIDVLLNMSLSAVDNDLLPNAVFLSQNTPNPFNPSTTIFFDLPQGGRTELSVFDVRGSLVRTLESGMVESGRHQRTWLGKDDGGRQVPSGVYFYRLETDLGAVTKRMTLVK
jgi:hypothetical protein